MRHSQPKPNPLRSMDQWRQIREQERFNQVQKMNELVFLREQQRLLSLTPRVPRMPLTLQQSTANPSNSMLLWQKIRQQSANVPVTPSLGSKFSNQPVLNCGPMPDYGLSVMSSNVDCRRFDCGPMPDYGPTVMPCKCPGC